MPYVVEHYATLLRLERLSFTKTKHAINSIDITLSAWIPTIEATFIAALALSPDNKYTLIPWLDRVLITSRESSLSLSSKQIRPARTLSTATYATDWPKCSASGKGL